MLNISLAAFDLNDTEQFSILTLDLAAAMVLKRASRPMAEALARDQLTSMGKSPQEIDALVARAQAAKGTSS